MFGKNPIRKPLHGSGEELEVQNIFPTLQGEGPLAGHPAVFIRLGGCNLACEFCDTEFESYKLMTLADIMNKTESLAKNASGERVRNLVVITGGEPFRQPIEKLCEELVARKFKIQIETNGTLYRKLPDDVEIICSPKNTGAGYGRVRPDLMEKLTALKFIISAHNSKYSDIGDVGQKEYDTPVYVQPMDEYDESRNKKNLELALKLAETNGYRLSLQTHKYLGIE